MLQYLEKLGLEVLVYTNYLDLDSDLGTIKETGKKSDPFLTLELTLKKNVIPKCMVCGNTTCTIFVVENKIIKFYCSSQCQQEFESSLERTYAIKETSFNRIKLWSGISVILLLVVSFVYFW